MEAAVAQWPGGGMIAYAAITVCIPQDADPDRVVPGVTAWNVSRHGDRRPQEAVGSPTEPFCIGRSVLVSVSLVVVVVVVLVLVLVLVGVIVGVIVGVAGVGVVGVATGDTGVAINCPAQRLLACPVEVAWSFDPASQHAAPAAAACFDAYLPA